MTDDLETLIADIRSRGLADEATIELVRKANDVKTFRAALDMHAVAPGVFGWLISALRKSYGVETAPQKIVPGTRRQEVDTKVVTIAPSGSSKSEPRPISKEELKALIPSWKKEATTFEPAPLLQLAVGESALIRLKRVIKGVYEAPLVIASEVAAVDAEGNVGPIREGEVKIPSYLVRHATINDGVKLVPGLVYFVTLAGTKPTQYGNDFLQSKMKLIGDSFPK